MIDRSRFTDCCDAGAGGEGPVVGWCEVKWCGMGWGGGGSFGEVMGNVCVCSVSSAGRVGSVAVLPTVCVA